MKTILITTLLIGIGSNALAKTVDKIQCTGTLDKSSATVNIRENDEGISLVTVKIGRYSSYSGTGIYVRGNTGENELFAVLKGMLDEKGTSFLLEVKMPRNLKESKAVLTPRDKMLSNDESALSCVSN